MTEEVPLTEFVTDADPDEQPVSASEQGHSRDGATENTEARVSESDQSVALSEVRPAEPTGAYDPAGVTCDGCGETVTRRFNTEAGLRCVECVSWRADG